MPWIYICNISLKNSPIGSFFKAEAFVSEVGLKVKKVLQKIVALFFAFLWVLTQAPIHICPQYIGTLNPYWGSKGSSHLFYFIIDTAIDTSFFHKSINLPIVQTNAMKLASYCLFFLILLVEFFVKYANSFLFILTVDTEHNTYF